MSGIAEAKLAMDGIKLALDVIKALQSNKAAAEFKAELIDARTAILDAQEHASAAYARETELSNRVRQLEKELAALEAWSAEKERYELKDVGSGFIAYAVKEEKRGVEPPHHLCANCFDKGEKSILQPSGMGRYFETHVCPRCQNKQGLNP